MDIINVAFEEPLRLEIYGHEVILYAFKAVEPCHVKFGIQAPRSLKVHREEVYKTIMRRLRSEANLEAEIEGA